MFNEDNSPYIAGLLCFLTVVYMLAVLFLIPALYAFLIGRHFTRVRVIVLQHVSACSLSLAGHWLYFAIHLFFMFAFFFWRFFDAVRFSYSPSFVTTLVASFLNNLTLDLSLNICVDSPTLLGKEPPALIWYGKDNIKFFFILCASTV